jgi:predicted ABC-type ATPase
MIFTVVFNYFLAILYGMKTMKKHILKCLIILFLTLINPLKGQNIDKEKYKMQENKIQKYDIFNFDLIYNEKFSYSFPKELLEKSLNGKIYSNGYNPDELSKSKKDIEEIFWNTMSKNLVKGNSAVILAGAPGAGKTTLLIQKLKEENQKLKEKDKKDSEYAYVCPDKCLKELKRTYVADINLNKDSFETKNNAYTKWRDLSIAAKDIILAHLIKEKYSFYFDTTCSSPHTWKFLKLLKKHEYKIKIIHVSAPDKIRWESTKERDKTFVKTTKEDIYQKGLDVPQRINDTFLKYADEIEFHYRSGVFKSATLAAKWLKNKDVSKYKGTLEIINQKAYEGIKKVHNTAIENFKPNLKWEKAVESASIIID